jgi:hypothetical protein
MLEASEPAQAANKFFEHARLDTWFNKYNDII